MDRRYSWTDCSKGGTGNRGSSARRAPASAFEMAGVVLMRRLEQGFKFLPTVRMGPVFRNVDIDKRNRLEILPLDRLTTIPKF